MKINSETGILGLFGNPSRHSLSPLIQNHFLKSYSKNYVYLNFEPEPANLEEAFRGAKNLGFKGLNITMPFKEKIYEFVDKTEGAAKITRSVNTVSFLTGNNCISVGYSTDGEGLIKSLEDKKFFLDGKSCFVIGAGGAAKSAVYSIFRKPVKKIYIFDIVYDRSAGLLNTMALNIIADDDGKTVKKYPEDLKNGKIKKPGEKPADKKPGKIRKLYSRNADKILDNIDKKIKIITYINELENIFNSIDLVINCTPCGMDTGKNDSNINSCPLPREWDLKGKYVFDMVYKPASTNLIKKAERDGAAGIITGIDMLVNQAAHSFKLWFGIMPEENIIDEAKRIIHKWI